MTVRRGAAVGNRASKRPQAPGAGGRFVRRGAVKSVNHAMNLQDLFRQLFNHPSTLEDLGITEDRWSVVKWW